MLKSMTSWINGEFLSSGTRENASEQPDSTPKSNDVVSRDIGEVDEAVEKDTENVVNTTDDSIGAVNTLDDVGDKAKEWGSYLYSFGKSAGMTLFDTAKGTASLIKHTVEEKTLIGDFSKEQNKFIEKKVETKKRAEAAVPPWVGYNEEEQMKSQILALSLDRRNFLRNPPSGVQLEFDFTLSHPVAMAMLKEDPNLEKMRFALVPQQIKEEQFWRNYFYRVSLIKQSTQLSSMSQESRELNRSSPIPQQKEKLVESPGKIEAVDMLPESPADHEFASDAFSDTHVNEDDLRAEMSQLGVNKDKVTENTQEEDLGEWEEELQKELQEYEMVSGTLTSADVDDEIECEILAQIQDSS